MRPHIISKEDFFQDDFLFSNDESKSEQIAVNILEYIEDHAIDQIEPEFDIHNNSIGAYEYGSAQEIMPDSYSLECLGNKDGIYIYQIDLPEPYNTLELFEALNNLIDDLSILNEDTHTFTLRSGHPRCIDYTVELDIIPEIMIYFAEPIIFIRTEWRDR